MALLGIAAISYRIWGPKPDLGSVLPQHPGTVDAAPVTLAVGRLDPGSYRAPIAALEETLFGAATIDFDERRDRLVDTLDGVDSALRADAVDAGLLAAVDAMAADLDTIPTLDLTAIDTLRRHWLALRTRYFHPAPWMASDVESERDSAVLAAYRETADDLLRLLDDLDAERQALAPPPYPEDADDAQRRTAEWTASREAWSDRLAEATRRLPGRPTSGADPRLLAAVQRLENAVAGARALGADAGLPGRQDAGLRIEALGDELDAVRRTFDDLLLSS